MKCLAHTFSEYYSQVKILAIYRHPDKEEYAVESYDPSPSGRPINAHPLSEAEAKSLARMLSMTDKPTHFLLPEGLLPENVLSLSADGGGKVIWYTPAKERTLYFSENLAIPSGKAWIPPLLWVATRKNLRVFALCSEEKPNIKTNLYHAPFFNTDSSGVVCMGTVKVDIPETVPLETFLYRWQEYFFNSYFSHSNVDRSPLSVNIVTCWKKLIDTGNPFPVKALRKHSVTLKELL